MPAILGKMNRISRCAGLYRTEKLQNDELTSRHHSFVLAICHHPGMSQDQIARHLCLNKSTVTRALNQLEIKGYVLRMPSKTDKRVTLVYPTEKMLEIFPKVRAISTEWNEQLAEGISPDEFDLFWSVLVRMETRAKELTGITDTEVGTVTEKEGEA